MDNIIEFQEDFILKFVIFVFCMNKVQLKHVDINRYKLMNNLIVNFNNCWLCYISEDKDNNLWSDVLSSNV